MLRVSDLVSVAAAAAEEAGEEEEAGAAGEAGGAAAAVGADESGGETDADDDALSIHCFRGRVGPTTLALLRPSRSFKGTASQRAVSDGLILVGSEPRKVRAHPPPAPSPPPPPPHSCPLHTPAPGAPPIAPHRCPHPGANRADPYRHRNARGATRSWCTRATERPSPSRGGCSARASH